ncbi:MAG TPA: FAD-binding oxidoreductase, partial [Oscillatoriaceae cyanobacterium]
MVSRREKQDDKIWTHLEKETTPPAITMFGARQIDVEALVADLKRAIKGEVRFDDGSRALYATDASNYRQLPIGVVLPRDKHDVIQAIAVCRRHGAPITNRGGGTSLAGQTCNTAVILDFSKYMNHVLEIDAEARWARVQPGTILDDLRAAAEKHGLTFGPDPATHDHCTLGGMMGNDSCGMHAQMSGRTSQNTLELEFLLYDGTILHVKDHYAPEEIQREIDRGGRQGEVFARLRDLRDRYAETIRERFPIGLPRLVSGYGMQFLLPEKGFNVAGALIGSEGTLGTILEAKLRLVESPPHRTLVMLGYPSVYEAGDHVPDILPFAPIALEGLDDILIEYMRKKHLHTDYLHLLPEGKGWLMVEIGGDTPDEADGKARGMVEALSKKPDAPHMAIIKDPKQVAHLWKVRESGLGATAFVPGEKDSWPGWEDSAVPPDQVGAYLRDLRALFTKHGYHPSLYGHFGQGCIHCRVQFDLFTESGIENYRNFAIEAAELVTRYGGSLSGEHGDGQARGELLPIMFGDTIMQAFREFKAVFDPESRMNPGKLIDAYPLDSNLRLGTSYDPPEVATHFRYPDDKGHFSHATLRCVGVGECRRLDGKNAEEGQDVMCPSFMVTREEKHSTRGR